MTRDEIVALLERLADAWNAGDASGAARCFSPDVDYADPLRYRFSSRAELVPFFEPPSGGHSVAWHRLLVDEQAATAVVEYTYVGHHRYHGAAIASVGRDGLIAEWREWQHLDDERDWAAFRSGAPVG